MESFVCNNLSINEQGHLTFAGVDTIKLAEKYGTPLYIMDEEKLRENCKKYVETFQTCFAQTISPSYASKANSFTEIYRIMKEENMGIDVVSCGEIVTAVHANYPMEKAYFHGNNKTDEDIAFAIDQKVGYFVVDNMDEIYAIDSIAEEKKIIQNVLIRITPGIDPHTYAAVNTGMVDSKFGNAIETGMADEIVKVALSLKHIHLCGFHCHVGSQVFGEDVFERTIKVMVAFLKHVKNVFGYEAEQLDIGGGIGTKYVNEDGNVDICAKIQSIANTFHEECEYSAIKEPAFIMEPGRSIVADAGLTIYKIGSVKKIKGYRNYISVDGGMTDNPRYALYRSKYTCLPANKMQEDRNMKCTIAGRCCESGDLLAEDISLPEDIQRGDYLAVCTTGAYNYSMASNYNRLPRPCIVMLNQGLDRIVVKRETWEDITKLDI